MEAIRLYQLMTEVKRAMRFFDYTIGVQFFNKWMEIKGIVVYKEIIETKQKPSDEELISILKQIDDDKLFEKKVDMLSPPDDEFEMRGKILAFSRAGNFIEMDVMGHRKSSIAFVSDVHTEIKNPVEQDIAYVLEKYPDIYEKIIEKMKKILQYEIAENPGKRANLSRMINYIRNLDQPSPVEKSSSFKEER